MWVECEGITIMLKCPSSLFFFWQVTLFVSLLIRWAIPLTLHDFRLWVDLTTTATTGFNPRVFLAPACRWQDSPRTAQSWEMQRPQVTETYWHMQLMLLRCYLFSSHRWQPEPPPTLSAPGACSCRGSTRCGRLRVFVPVHGHLVLATLGYPWQLVLKGSFLSLLLISCHLIFALASEMAKLVVGVGLDFIQGLRPLVVILDVSEGCCSVFNIETCCSCYIFFLVSGFWVAFAAFSQWPKNASNLRLCKRLVSLWCTCPSWCRFQFQRCEVGIA